VTAFAHAPYAAGKSPFSIGLAPLDLADWIESDELLVEQLARKEAILADEPEAFAALAESAAGQREVLELLIAHLPVRFPDIYRRDGAAMRVVASGGSVALAGEPPLLIASRLVQEDLLLMQRGASAWGLVAGSLCFPSGWLLSEKLGRDLDAIHAPVPGFVGRMGDMVSRIFDNLQAAQPVERFNWSIYGDADLRHAQSRQTRFPQGVAPGPLAHIRVERQTLRRLARSGDILFTLRVHVDPLAAVARHPRGRLFAGSLRAQIRELNADQLAYKGLSEARDGVLEALAQFI
jgi:dimethylamine monooxygenase subunit A